MSRHNTVAADILPKIMILLRQDCMRSHQYRAPSEGYVLTYTRSIILEDQCCKTTCEKRWGQSSALTYHPLHQQQWQTVGSDWLGIMLWLAWTWLTRWVVVHLPLSKNTRISSSTITDYQRNSLGEANTHHKSQCRDYSRCGHYFACKVITVTCLEYTNAYISMNTNIFCMHSPELQICLEQLRPPQQRLVARMTSCPWKYRNERAAPLRMQDRYPPI